MSEKPEERKDGQARVYDPGKSQTKEAAPKSAGIKPAGLAERSAAPQAAEAKDNKMSMREMAARDTRYHLQPMPEAQPAEVDPFPVPVMRGLVIGLIAGLLLGVGWAALMLNGLVVIGGWEGLFSMTTFTFYVFWTLIGLSFGGLVSGVAAILRHPGPQAKKG